MTRLLAEAWASMTCLPSLLVYCGLEVLSWSPGDLRLTTVFGVVSESVVKVDERLGWKEPGWSGKWKIKGWLWRLAKASKKVGLTNQILAGNPQKLVWSLEWDCVTWTEPEVRRGSKVACDRMASVWGSSVTGRSFGCSGLDSLPVPWVGPWGLVQAACPAQWWALGAGTPVQSGAFGEERMWLLFWEVRLVFEPCKWTMVGKTRL